MVALCISRTSVLISLNKKRILKAEDTDTQTQAINIVHLSHLLKTDGVSHYTKVQEGGEGI